MRRIAAIAIDAGAWKWLGPLAADGRLPHLARLRSTGATVELHNDPRYRSSLSWARFLTGREPIDHGDWAVATRFRPESYTLEALPATTTRPFYALADTPVIALDVPNATPSDDVEGTQVVAWGSHSPQWPRTSRPAGLLTEIDARFGTSPAFGNEFDYGWNDPAFIDALAGACRVAVERRTEIAAFLLDRQPDWRLFVMGIAEIHSLGHQCWFGVDPDHPLHGVAPTTALAARRMEELAVAVDASIGRVADLVGDAAIVVFSVHGFLPAEDTAATILLPELFHRLHTGGRLFRDFPGPGPVVPGPDDHIGSLIGRAFADTRAARVRRAARAIVPVRRRTVSPAAMSRSTPPETLEVNESVLAAFRKSPDYDVTTWYRRHWPVQRWFALPAFDDGHVRVNLAGRERDGVVARDDYTRALDEIEEILAACRHPRTGSSIVEEVTRMRTDDPMDPEGPDADLLVQFAGAADALVHPTAGRIGPFPNLRTAQHDNTGFAVLAGAGLRGDLGVRPTADLVPTILGLAGAPVGDGIAGRTMLGPP